MVILKMDEAVVDYIRHATIPTLHRNIVCRVGGGTGTGTEGGLKDIF